MERRALVPSAAVGCRCRIRGLWRPMRRSRNLRRASWIIALVVGQGCGDSVSLVWELPFDPTGTWEAHVQGLRSGSGIDDLMVLTLSLDGEPWIPPGADFAVVEFTGTWEWGAL